MYKWTHIFSIDFTFSARRSRHVGSRSPRTSIHDPSRQRRKAASKMEEETVPSIEELKKLKVVDLKARLSSVGLQTSGNVISDSFYLSKRKLYTFLLPCFVDTLLQVLGTFVVHVQNYRTIKATLRLIFQFMLFVGLKAELIARLHSYFLSVRCIYTSVL